MRKSTLLLVCSIFMGFFLNPDITWTQKADPTVLDFKVQPMYRSAKITWKVKEGFKTGMAVQILRADTFEEGPYKEVDAVQLISGKNTYEYVDKTMGAESKYYYKLFIKETDESIGPLPTRPFFSPPATQYQPPVKNPWEKAFLTFFSLPSKGRDHHGEGS